MPGKGLTLDDDGDDVRREFEIWYVKWSAELEAWCRKQRLQLNEQAEPQHRARLAVINLLANKMLTPEQQAWLDDWTERMERDRNGRWQ